MKTTIQKATTRIELEMTYEELDSFKLLIHSGKQNVLNAYSEEEEISDTDCNTIDVANIILKEINK